MEYRIDGVDELRRAIARNPEKVKSAIKDFFTEALAVYRRTIKNNPWRVGGTGGGAPVLSGHLRDTHRQEIMDWEATIGADVGAAPYAEPVHEGRPWLDYAFNENQAQVDKLADKMLINIIEDLAR